VFLLPKTEKELRSLLPDHLTSEFSYLVPETLSLTYTPYGRSWTVGVDRVANQ